MNTSKKTAISVLSVAMVGGLIGMMTSESRAIPPDGFLLIFTVDIDTGLRVGNLPVRVVQIEAENVEIPPIHADTDDFGRLYLNVPPGTYKIRAEHGLHSSPVASVASNSEAYVAVPVDPVDG